MSQSPVVLSPDYGGIKIAAAVCYLAGQRLAPVVMPSRGELGARDSFAHGIETARDLLRAAAPGAELGGVGMAAFGIPLEDRLTLSPCRRPRRRPPSSLPSRRAGQPDRAPRRAHL